MLSRYIKRFFLCGCLLAGGFPAAYGQPSAWSGTVTDSQEGGPVAGAILMLKDTAGKVVRHTMTSANGRFSLSLPSLSAGHILHVSCMSYEPQSIPAADLRNGQQIALVPAPTILREVVVKAPPIIGKRDTLVFNVENFADIQDKTIGDVLKKMPGIEVESGGQIKYQGEPINKFYVEGTDMLEGKYGLATNNISHKDVKSVELMENHQPIRALEDIVHSENAAINLRLKEDAKARWVGTAGVGSGASPVLWEGSLFAMRIAAGWQSMQNLKVNNTGRNLLNENRNFSIDDIINAGDNRLSLGDHIRLNAPVAPIGEKRTRFNRSALFNTTNSRKITDDYQLNVQLTYAGDRLTGNRTGETTHFLEEGDRVVREEESTLTRQHDLSGKFTLQGNKPEFFLKNNLTTEWGWNDREANLNGTYPNFQQASLPSGNFSNDFQLVKRAGKRSFTLTSFNQYQTRPHDLTVERSGQIQHQDVHSQAFYTHSNISYGWGRKRWQFSTRAGLSFHTRKLTSELTGVEELPQEFTLENNSVMNTFRTYLTPSVSYRTPKVELTTVVPLNYYHYTFRDKIRSDKNSDNDWVMAPQFSVRYSLSAKWKLSASARMAKRAVNESYFYHGLILNNYRNLSLGLADYTNGSDKLVSARFEYKNPISAFFMNGAVVRAWNTFFPLSEQWFTGEYILNTYRPESGKNRAWNLRGSISKGIDGVKGVIALDAVYSHTEGEMQQNGNLTPYTSTSLTVSPRFKGRLSRFCNLEYNFSFRRTGLEIPSRNESSNNNSFSQTLSVHLVPVRTFFLTLSGEHYYTELSDDRAKDLFLADLNATWRPKERWELTLAMTNLFDRREYSYVLYGSLSSAQHAYPIRPRQFLASLYFRF